jgi:CheY-like chemotaxis protein
MSHGKKSTILLIESEVSLRRLISLGLQDHGSYVVEASEPTAIPSFDTQQLDLIVIDVDCGARSDWSFLEVLASHTQLSALPTIILAWDQPEPDCVPSSVASLLQPQEQTRVVFLSKPFDARALHEAIASLLLIRTQQEAQREAQIEARVLAAYATHAAPSIWPVVTAVGVLLMVCGLLLQVAITALGIFVVIAALLLWTVNTGPQGLTHRNLLLSKQDL